MTASNTEDIDVILSVSLVTAYVLLCVFCFFQISRLLYYRHALRSFQFGFLCLCLLWCILRIVFFLAWEHLSPIMLRVVFQLPVDLQFMTFSLLVLFFAFLLHQFEWRTKQNKAVGIYVALNSSLIIATAVYLQQLCKTGQCIATPGLERMHRIYTLCNFLLLVLMFAYISYQMYKHDNSVFARGGADAAQLAHVAWIIFLSRLVYNVMVTVSDEFSIYNYFSSKVDIVLFKWWGILLLALWEIVPSLAVLIFFRVIPPTSSGFCHRRCLNIYYLMGESPLSRPEHTVGLKGLTCADRMLYVISRIFCCPPNLEAVQDSDTQDYFPPAYEGLPSQHAGMLTDEGHPVDGYGGVDSFEGSYGVYDPNYVGSRGDLDGQYHHNSATAGSFGPSSGRYYVALHNQGYSYVYQPTYDERYALYSQDPSSFSLAEVGTTPTSPTPSITALGNQDPYLSNAPNTSLMNAGGQFAAFPIEQDLLTPGLSYAENSSKLSGSGSINSRE